MLISWIPPSIPNGIITTYNLYLNYSDGLPVSAVQSNTLNTNFTVTNLQPYQLISVMISANTEAGEGPLSEFTSGRSRELGTCICMNLNGRSLLLYISLLYILSPTVYLNLLSIIVCSPCSIMINPQLSVSQVNTFKYLIAMSLC